MQHREQIAHCHKGLENAQQTIRFIDTKTGVVFALGGGLLGWQLKYTGCLLKAESGLWGGIPPFLVLGVFAFLACGLVCMGLSLGSLLARPRKGTKGGTFIALFPSVKKGDWSGSAVGFDRLVRGLDEDQVSREYAGQLAVLGYILNRKMAYHRAAVYCLFAAVLVTIAVCLCEPTVLCQP